MGQIVDLGYKANTFTLNLGSLALFLMIYNIRLMLYGLFCLYLWRLESLRKTKTKSMKNQNLEAWEKEYKEWVKLVALKKEYEKELIWNKVLAIVLEGCFEFAIAGYLQLHHPEWAGGEGFSTVFATYCLFLTLVIFPLAMIYVIKQNSNRLHEKDFQ